MLDSVFHGCNAGADIGEQCYFAGATGEVGVERVDELGIVFDKHVCAALQAVDPCFRSHDTLLEVVLALAGESGYHLLLYVGRGGSLLGCIHNQILVIGVVADLISSQARSIDPRWAKINQTRGLFVANCPWKCLIAQYNTVARA